jgi:ankyrin repeat protein
MLFRAEMRNEGPESITFWDHSDPRACLDVKLPSGQEAHSIGIEIVQLAVSPKTISPGETIVLHDNVDLWRLYFLERPGPHVVRFASWITVDRKTDPEMWGLLGDRLDVPSNEVRIELEAGDPLPPAYRLAGMLHQTRPRGWSVMLDRVGDEAGSGEVSCYSAHNWIRIRVGDKELPLPGPEWESWGKSRLGFVCLSLPVRAESKWPGIREQIQRIVRASEPILFRRGQESDLLALHSAIREENEEALLQIVKEHPEFARQSFELDSDRKGGKEETLLHVAARSGMKALAALVLDLGSDIDALCRDGTTPLLFAAEAGDMDMVRLLARRKADLDKTTKWRGTPLGAAAGERNLDVVRCLLDAGADPNGFTRGLADSTPLQGALAGGKIEIVQMLLDRGADPDLCPAKSTSPLQCAVLRGNLEAARLLLARGANANWVSETEKLTALHLAAYEGHLDMVRLLVECGAELNPEDWRRETPLAWANKAHRGEVAAYLRSKGAE